MYDVVIIGSSIFRELIKSKYAINAAGVYADKIHDMICKESFKITPRKCQYYVMNKSQGNLISHAVFPCPSKLGKGILVAQRSMKIY